MNAIPKLIISKKPLKAILQSLASPGTLFVTDAYSDSIAKPLGITYRADSNSLPELIHASQCTRSTQVIGVGGCTALDAGRYLAQKNTFISVPTILSNSCISVNRSVVFDGIRSYSIPTRTPVKTIVSLPEILQTPPDALHMWCSSGCGDLFSNIAACIEEHYTQNSDPLSYETLIRATPTTFKAMAWIFQEKKAFIFSKPRIIRLAKFLHHSSCDVIRRGNTTRSAGSEHALYYQMLHDHHYPKNGPTHGQLVTIGTLCTTYLHAQLSGDRTVFEQILRVYRKLKLPTTWQGLLSIGVTRGAVLESLRALNVSNRFYATHLVPHAESLLDAIYGKHHS